MKPVSHDDASVPEALTKINAPSVQLADTFGCSNVVDISTARKRRKPVRSEIPDFTNPVAALRLVLSREQMLVRQIFAGVNPKDVEGEIRRAHTATEILMGRIEESES